jgi:hypothetical protein
MTFHGENEVQLLQATLSDVLPDDLPKFKKVLNDYLDNGDADDTATDFIFNGWEDVSVICKSGKEFLICSETTFAELLEMISA